MVFAAGMGTRLKPFTEHHPKALVPVGGVPMLERVVSRLKDAGVTEVIINVHHFADQVVDFVRSRGNFGIDVYISDESNRLLDTGGGMLKARDYLLGPEPFIVHNADILCNVDLCDMMRRHCDDGNDVTLLAMPRNSSRHFYFDRPTGRLVGWGDDRTGDTIPAWLSVCGMDKLSFGGVHVISPLVLDALVFYSARVGKDIFSITPFYADFASALTIRAYTPPAQDAVWMDIGSPEKLQLADRAVSNGLI